MILELRMSAEDGVDGGMEIRDMVEFCREIDGMADIIHVSNGLKWAGNQTQTFSDFFDVHGVNAVSYTHLDVYKRQVLLKPGI